MSRREKARAMFADGLDAEHVYRTLEAALFPAHISRDYVMALYREWQRERESNPIKAA